MSTAAGIKDFRSANGLYADSATTQMFSVDFLQRSPQEFYERVREMFLPVVDGRITPTRSHAFLRLLKDLGWLKRVYTQNVDMLEYPLLDRDDVVECHGSFSRAYCLNSQCKFRLRESSEMSEFFWAPIRKGNIPNCTLCGSLLRPDVTFFGEPLANEFSQLSLIDLPKCDLLLVVGTTLLVHPVASIPQMVNPLCVRMLINREATGCFKGLPSAMRDGKECGVPQYVTKSYRDVFFEGDCDAGCVILAEELGLTDQLDEIFLSVSAPPATNK